jgi:hypothetical protein
MNDQSVNGEGKSLGAGLSGNAGPPFTKAWEVGPHFHTLKNNYNNNFQKLKKIKNPCWVLPTSLIF